MDAAPPRGRRFLFCAGLITLVLIQQKGYTVRKAIGLSSKSPLGMNEKIALQRKSVLPIVLLLLTAVLYLPVAIPLVRQWLSDPNYRHGIVIPLISALILWTRRKELAVIEPKSGSMAGFVLVFMAAGFLVIGTAASEFFTSRFSIPVMIIGFAYIIGGRAFVEKARFPLLFLFLMIPLPYIIYYKITFPLQIMSAKISAAVLGLLHIAVIRRGNVLVLPNYELEVVAACSGLRSLMTMFTLALIFSVFSGLSNVRRVILVACAVPAAIMANTLRLVVTAIGAYAISPAFAEGTLHEIAGLIVFFAGFLLLVIALGILRWNR
jgi:exosortase